MKESTIMTIAVETTEIKIIARRPLETPVTVSRLDETEIV